MYQFNNKYTKNYYSLQGTRKCYKCGQKTSHVAKECNFFKFIDLPIELILAILSYLLPKDILEISKLNNTFLNFTEDQVFIKQFKERFIDTIDNTNYQTLTLSYIPDFENRMNNKFKFKRVLPSLIFKNKMWSWLVQSPPARTVEEMSRIKHTLVTQSSNFFVQEAEYKAAFVNLNRFEKKCLKWEAKYNRLIYNKDNKKL